MFTQSASNTNVSVPSRPRASLPVLPLPAMHGRVPVIINAGHYDVVGVELAYPRDGVADLITTYPLNSPNGTATHFMPERVPAFAVRDGSITFAAKEGNGHALLVDHGNGWATYYDNLEHMFARPTDKRARRRLDRVKAGDILGYVGAPWPGGFKRLRFELWALDEDGELSAVDPRGEMTRWRVMPWDDTRIATSSEPQVAA